MGRNSGDIQTREEFGMQSNAFETNKLDAFKRAHCGKHLQLHDRLRNAFKWLRHRMRLPFYLWLYSIETRQNAEICNKNASMRVQIAFRDYMGRSKHVCLCVLRNEWHFVWFSASAFSWIHESTISDWIPSVTLSTPLNEWMRSIPLDSYSELQTQSRETVVSYDSWSIRRDTIFILGMHFRMNMCDAWLPQKM